MKIIRFFRSEPFSILLIFLPLAILAELFHWGPTWVFLLSAVAIIPMAR